MAGGVRGGNFCFVALTAGRRFCASEFRPGALSVCGGGSTGVVLSAGGGVICVRRLAGLATMCGLAAASDGGG